MPLELINTISSLATVAIVAAAAVAALVQLRHLRAGNQINSVLAIGDRFSSREYQDAVDLMTRDLERSLADPTFRNYEIAVWRRSPPPDVDAGYVNLHRATITVGNRFEELGILVRHRIIDEVLFIDLWCAVVLGGWKRLEKYVALGREASVNEALWENFEYLAVLSEEWIKQHPSSYPKGLRRLELRNPWLVEPSKTSARYSE